MIGAPGSRHPGRIVRPAVVAAGLVAALGLLSALYPRRLRELALSNEGSVTAAYRRSMAPSSPSDPRLRRSLVQDGVFDDDELARMVTDDEPPVAAEAFRRLVDRWRATTQGSRERARSEARLQKSLAAGFDERRSSVPAEVRAKTALELGRPDLAARWWLVQAVSGEGNARLAALACIDAALASPAAADVVRIAGRLSARFEGDTTVALAVERLVATRAPPAEAVRWWRARLARDGTDVAALARLRDALLALDDARAALEPAEALAAFVPSEARSAARIARWAGMDDRAQAWWTRLGDAGDIDALAAALRLAVQRADHLEAARLGLVLAEARPLEPAEADGIAAALAASVRSSEAPQALVALAARPDATATVLETLARTCESTSAPADAVRVRRELVARFGRTPDRTLAEASLLHRLGRASEADGLLKRHAIPAGDEALRLVAAVAFDAGDRNAAGSAYTSLLNRGLLLPGEDDRLVWLRAQEDPAAGLALAASLWRASRRPRDLLRALSTGVQAGRWEAVGKLVDEAEASGLAAVDASEWWCTRGELAVHEGRPSKALEAFEAAWRLSPAQDGLPARMLWLALETDERPTLDRLLARWSGGIDDAPHLWPWFARGHERLGRTEAALALYDRAAVRSPEDTPLMTAYANTLAKTGRHQEARDVRRAAFARLRTSPDDASSASLAAEFLPAEEARRWTTSHGTSRGTRARWSDEAVAAASPGPRYGLTFDTLQVPSAGLVWREAGATSENGPWRLVGRTGRRFDPSRHLDTGLLEAALIAGHATLSAGTDLRTDSLVGQAAFRHVAVLDGPLSLQSALVWNETRSLPWGLAADAARRTASMAVRYESAPLAGWAALKGHRYVTRRGAPLADGVSSEASLDLRLSPRLPEASLQLSASLSANVDRSGGTRPVRLANWLPERFGAVGTGLAWRGGPLDDAHRRLRFGGEAWAGVLLPSGRMAVRARAGAGVRLWPGVDLVLDAYGLDDQPLAGTGAVVGLDVRLALAL
jgi:tetratricopeptide (TPR) repeat protein